MCTNIYRKFLWVPFGMCINVCKNAIFLKKKGFSYRNSKLKINQLNILSKHELMVEPNYSTNWYSQDEVGKFINSSRTTIYWLYCSFVDFEIFKYWLQSILSGVNGDLICSEILCYYVVIEISSIICIIHKWPSETISRYIWRQRFCWKK